MLSLASHPARVGHALLTVPGRAPGPLALSIGFADGTFLGPDGRRSRARHLFDAEPQAAPGTYALGPAVTAHVPEAETVTLAGRDGTPLGTLAWDGIRPPPEASPGARILGVPRPADRAAPSPRVGEGGPAPRPAAAPAVPDRAAPPVPGPPAREGRRGARAAAGVAALLILALAGAAALVLSGKPDGSWRAARSPSRARPTAPSGPTPRGRGSWRGRAPGCWPASSGSPSSRLAPRPGSTCGRTGPRAPGRCGPRSGPARPRRPGTPRSACRSPSRSAAPRPAGP